LNNKQETDIMSNDKYVPNNNMNNNNDINSPHVSFNNTYDPTIILVDKHEQPVNYYKEVNYVKPKSKFKKENSSFEENDKKYTMVI